MNAKWWLMFSVLFLIAGTAAPAWGQQSGSAQIDTILTSNQPFEIFLPNVNDPFHPKILTFDGLVSNLQPGTTGSLDLQFDWFDPKLNQFVFSPVFTTLIIPNPLGLPTPVRNVFTIPFCPPEVSLHLSNPGLAPLKVSGVFTHECIPEPSSMVLAGFALTALSFVAWRKRAG